MNNLTKYAVIDLHLHLDGSLSKEAIIKIAKHEKILLPTYIPEKLAKLLSVDETCTSLVEYLTKFDVPNLVLQTSYGIKEATLDLLSRLARDGLKYVEIRMAPQLSTNKGLSQEEVAKALLEARFEALRDYGIGSNFILCLLRGASDQANCETLRVIQKHLNHGVVAFDLAGDEVGYPNELYLNYFAYCNENHIPFTVHASEALGPESLNLVLPYKPNRIGHGIHAYDDKNVLADVIKQKVPLEICPKSNLDTKAINSYEDLHLKELLSLGVIVTINTDDMSVSNTTLKKEYQTLIDLGLSEQEIKQIALNSAESAFLPQDQKDKLIAYINSL